MQRPAARLAILVVTVVALVAVIALVVRRAPSSSVAEPPPCLESTATLPAGDNGLVDARQRFPVVPCRRPNGRYVMAVSANAVDESAFAPGTPVTDEQRAAADDLVRRSRAFLARYRTQQDALADGWQRWTDVDQLHLVNTANMTDGRVLDPDHPESLMMDGEGRIVAVMYVMPSPDKAGPQPGGPLMVWHYHDLGRPTCYGFGGIQPQPLELDPATGACRHGTTLYDHSSAMVHVWRDGPLEQAFRADMSPTMVPPR